MLLKPVNNPLGVSPSKGKQETTRGKEKIEDLTDLLVKDVYKLGSIRRTKGEESNYINYKLQKVDWLWQF